MRVEERLFKIFSSVFYIIKPALSISFPSDAHSERRRKPLGCAGDDRFADEEVRQTLRWFSRTWLGRQQGVQCGWFHCRLQQIYWCRRHHRVVVSSCCCISTDQRDHAGKTDNSGTYGCYRYFLCLFWIHVFLCLFETQIWYKSP